MSEKELRVALAQFAPHPHSVANVRAITALATEAHASGARVLLLPEYSQAFISGGGDSWAEVAEELDGEFVTALMALCSELEGLVIIAGMLVRVPGERPRNTIVAIGPGGVLARAEKLHLYDAFGAAESRSVSPGDIEPPQILDFGGLRWGFLACYDIRFPEVARRLVDAGATCIVVPAQWFPGQHKVEHWKTLLGARAIETQCFVLAAGHPAPHGIGHSRAIDPWGVTLGHASESAELLVVSLTVESVEAVRTANPMAGARRFDVIPRP
jgi:predicted amidohydrolase